jgi:hypothetical protein
MKSRVIIQSNNQRKELFSIKERDNKELLIMFKPTESRYVIEEGENIDIKHQKYSIHNNIHQTEEDDGYNLIKETVVLDNGTLMETYLRSDFEKKNQYALLFLKRESNLENSIFNTNVKTKDKICILDTMELRNVHLVYGIAVTTKNRGKILRDSLWNFKTITFSNYNVIVIWTYLKGLPINGSDVVACASGERLINKKFEKLPPKKVVTSISSTKKQLIDNANFLLKGLKTRILIRTSELYGNSQLKEVSELINLQQKRPSKFWRKSIPPLNSCKSIH